MDVAVFLGSVYRQEMLSTDDSDMLPCLIPSSYFEPVIFNLNIKILLS